MNNQQNKLSIINNFDFRGQFEKYHATVAFIPKEEITKQYQTLLKVPFVVVQQKYELINNEWLLISKQLIEMDKMQVSSFPVNIEADPKWRELYHDILNSKISGFKENNITLTLTSEITRMTRNYLYIQPNMPIWEILFWLYGIKYQ